MINHDLYYLLAEKYAYFIELEFVEFGFKHGLFSDPTWPATSIYRGIEKLSAAEKQAKIVEYIIDVYQISDPTVLELQHPPTNDVLGSILAILRGEF